MKRKPFEPLFVVTETNYLRNKQLENEKKQSQDIERKLNTSLPINRRFIVTDNGHSLYQKIENERQKEIDINNKLDRELSAKRRKRI